MSQDVIQVFIWICALGAAVAIPMSLRKSKLASVGWICFYLLAYWHLSTNGRYVQSRAIDRWMPMHCETVLNVGTQEKPALNALGAFFSPLVFVDRMVIHPTKEPNQAASL